jgi:hypothetical protein
MITCRTCQSQIPSLCRRLYCPHGRCKPSIQRRQEKVLAREIDRRIAQAEAAQKAARRMAA